jgi:dolichol-phosphate mannosyltransferase
MQSASVARTGADESAGAPRVQNEVQKVHRRVTPRRPWGLELVAIAMPGTSSYHPAAMHALTLTDQGADGLLPVPNGDLTVSPTSRDGIRLSLIVPTFNEGKNVGEMVRRLTDLLDGPLGGAYELIVVDDDSPDKTWEIAAALTSEYPKVRVMRRQGERGLSTAVIRGWQAARGEVLAVIDADLQHPPEVTLDLWKHMASGADLAVASRHVEGGGVSDWALYRRILSRGAQLLGLALLPGVLGRVSDPMSGYFMIQRSAIARKKMSPVGYKILIEVVGRGDVRRIGEVGYVFRERVAGESKVTWKLYLDYLRHLVRLRLDTLPVARFVRFCLVGASGVAVDMGLLYVLSDPATLHMGLTRSKLIAAEFAILNNFIWNDAWTFRDMTAGQRTLRSKVKRFIKFNLICSIGLALNILLLNMQFNSLGMNRYVANATAIAIVTVWNFWLNTRLSWRSSETSKLPGGPARS